ncbi:MAG: PulJ/GspJ family protein [Desulfobulbus sp.]|jgi:general secretion pathway protein J
MRSPEQGFTLLEVMLAVAILGMVAAMLSISLGGSLRTVSAVREEEEVFFLAQTAMRRISEDLGGACWFSGAVFTGENNVIGEQRADTLILTTQAHLVVNPSVQRPGPATVRYRLEPDDEDPHRLRLLRSDTPLTVVSVGQADEEQAPFFLLADNLRSLRFSYFDREGQESDAWDGALAAGEEGQPIGPPAAVHCILEFWLGTERDGVRTFSTRVPVLVEVGDAP